MKQNCFMPAQILLPGEEVPLERWACIACDQFTSDRAYWQKAEQLAGDGPSALHIILPEVYLQEPDVQSRIQAIHKAMEQYAASVLTRTVNGYIYIERTGQNGKVRQGLVGMVDLEAYDYRTNHLPPVRPSESTVPQRIPPRLAVREGACLETPHVMMLADDPAGTVVEPLAAHKARLPKLYEGELMLGGGHIAGWAVEDPAIIAQVDAALAQLGSQQNFDRRYPQAAGSRPMTLAVGDGNHSLATAKAYWEKCKATLPPAQWAGHPARYCLAELCNVQSEAVEIEPIHRVIFGSNPECVLLSMVRWSEGNQAGLRYGSEDHQHFTMLGMDFASELGFASPTAALTVGTVDEFIEYFLESHPEASVDYVHGSGAVQALCQKGAVGFLLPPFEKSDLFRGVVLGGVLPRKTFSMGHAEEKRYYIECRRICPSGQSAAL